jgi:PHD and RING finger domain-containing protein 1
MNIKRKWSESDPEETQDNQFDSKANESSTKRQKGSSYDICPICLCPLSSFKTHATPDACDHVYCLECLEEWSKNVNTCPTDRKAYSFIIVKDSATLQTIRKIPVEDRTQVNYDDGVELTYCEICHLSDREDRMLLCDECDRGYHCKRFFQLNLFNQFDYKFRFSKR